MIINNDRLLSLSPMDRGRVEKSLNKNYIHKGRVKSMREIVIDYPSKSVKQVSKVQFNRTKYNRMDGKEQADYEKKLKETKTVYTLVNFDKSYLEIPKIVFDLLD